MDDQTIVGSGARTVKASLRERGIRLEVELHGKTLLDEVLSPDGARLVSRACGMAWRGQMVDVSLDEGHVSWYKICNPRDPGWPLMGCVRVGEVALVFHPSDLMDLAHTLTDYADRWDVRAVMAS